MRNQAEESFSFNQTIFYEVGIVKKIIRVRVLELVDLFENYSHFAIRFEFFHPESEQTYFVNVPGDEIEDFCLALDRIVKFLSTKTEQYSEVVYKSAQGFETGCYWEAEEKKWVPYARFGNVPESITGFSDEDYKEFVKTIKKAKTKIR